MRIIDKWSLDHTTEDVPVAMEANWEPIDHITIRYKVECTPPYET